MAVVGHNVTNTDYILYESMKVFSQTDHICGKSEQGAKEQWAENDDERSAV